MDLPIQVDQMIIQPQMQGMDRKGVSEKKDDGKGFEDVLSQREQPLAQGRADQPKEEHPSASKEAPVAKASVTQSSKSEPAKADEPKGLPSEGPSLQKVTCDHSLQLIDDALMDKDPLKLPLGEMEGEEKIPVLHDSLPLVAAWIAAKVDIQKSDSSELEASPVVLNPEQDLKADTAKLFALTDASSQPSVIPLPQTSPNSLESAKLTEMAALVRPVARESKLEISKVVESSASKVGELQAEDFLSLRESIWGINETNEPKLELALQDQESSQESFSDFVSSLYVQKNLKAEMPIQFSEQLAKVQVTEEKPVAQMIRSHLGDDLKVHLTKMVSKQEGGEVSLQLRPGDLGNVKIDIRVEQESVRIEMRPERSAAESVLKSQMGELRNQLQSAGFKVDEIQVSQQKFNSELADQRQSQEQARDRRDHDQPKRRQDESTTEFQLEVA